MTGATINSAFHLAPKPKNLRPVRPGDTMRASTWNELVAFVRTQQGRAA